jgi:hypothetical protein
MRAKECNVVGDQTLSSSYERERKAEERTKEWLQRKFNVPFSRRNLQVGQKSDGTPAMHNFDFVSEVGQIVAEVKSHQLTKIGSVPSGKISDAYKACFMLEKISARKKLLILADSEFYKIFKRYSDGKISNEIEIVLLANKVVEIERLGAKQIPSLNKAENSKKTDFDTFWSELTSWLSNEKHIINWTVNSGEIGDVPIPLI